MHMHTSSYKLLAAHVLAAIILRAHAVDYKDPNQLCESASVIKSFPNAQVASAQSTSQSRVHGQQVKSAPTSQLNKPQLNNGSDPE